MRSARVAQLCGAIRGALLGAIVITTLIFVALAAPLLAPLPRAGAGEAHVQAWDLAPSRSTRSAPTAGSRRPEPGHPSAPGPAIVVSLLVVILAVLDRRPAWCHRRLPGGGRVDGVMMRTDGPVPRVPAAAARDGDRRRRSAPVSSTPRWRSRSPGGPGMPASLAASRSPSLSRPFVDAARVIGSAKRVIVVRHVIPNSLGRSSSRPRSTSGPSSSRPARWRSSGSAPARRSLTGA